MQEKTDRQRDRQTRLFYRETRQEPSKSAENECLNEPDYVEEFPSLQTDAVTRKENCDGTVDGNTQSKNEKPGPEKHI